MAKSYFIPSDDNGKVPWLNNFSGKLSKYNAIVGISAAEVASAVADAAFFAYVLDAKNQTARYAQNWTAYKNAARDGGSMGEIPAAPVLGVAPALVAPGIFSRAAALAVRIKKHPGYTEAMGRDLGIIGAEETVDVNAMKPVLTLTLQGGKPNIGWVKNGMDSLEIWVDRGTGSFSFLTIDTVPDYLDTFAAAPGSSAAWKYKAIYRLHDDQVGQWSDVACVGVVG